MIHDDTMGINVYWIHWIQTFLGNASFKHMGISSWFGWLVDFHSFGVMLSKWIMNGYPVIKLIYVDLSCYPSFGVMLSKSCYHVIQEHSDASCCRLCFLATRRPATYEWFPEGIIDPSSQWYPTWILYRFHTTTGTFIMGMTYFFWTISWYMFLVCVFGFIESSVWFFGI